MIYLYLFGTCFHFIYVFMIIGNKNLLSFDFLALKNFLERMLEKKKMMLFMGHICHKYIY